MQSLMLFLLFIAGSAEAKPRIAQCVVKSSGSSDFRGPCRFHLGEKGSFTIEPVRKRSFGDASSISVYLVGRGEAEVRGITRDGINSRWGMATRSRRDRACWQGSDFSVCVYQKA
jgi:hypothetical protein